MKIAIFFTSVMLFAATLQPADVKVAGAIDYGQTSDPVEYSGTPRYAALVFNGKSGDQIEVSVNAGDRRAVISIADGSLKELATGTTKLTFTLPDHGPDTETYYIVFRDEENKPARFVVELKKPARV